MPAKSQTANHTLCNSSYKQLLNYGVSEACMLSENVTQKAKGKGLG